jgi:hypothetical protein
MVSAQNLKSDYKRSIKLDIKQYPAIISSIIAIYQ